MIPGSSPTVTGQVLDTRGNPLIGARVYFVDGPFPLPDIAALADSNGRFTLNALIPGTYQLGISVEGTAGIVQETTVRVEVREAYEAVLEVRQET